MILPFTTHSAYGFCTIALNYGKNSLEKPKDYAIFAKIKHIDEKEIG